MSRAAEATDTAADWIIRRENGDWSESDQAGLDAWLAESDGNKAAYWRIKHSWGEADRIGSLGVEADPKAPAGSGARRYWKPAALAASLAVAVWVGSIQLVPAPDRARPIASTFSAPIGERRNVALADGSHIELNTRSAIRASASTGRREIWLDQGEAFFEVAHDASRPFVVHAGDRLVTVLGTKFSVRRDGERVSVAVLEGRVRIDEVADGDIRPASTTITAGMSAMSNGRSMLVTERSDERVGSALAWRDGMLSFDQTTLADAAAEFSRYHRRPIVVTDPEAAAIRIGGTFQASNVEAFARLLRDAYGLRVEITPEAIKISS
jgi:transmembrane sensor